MGRCYCFVIDRRKDRFERARERRNRRRIREILAAGKAGIQIVIAMTLLGMMAIGIFVTLLTVSGLVGVSCVGTVFLMFGIAGPVGEALMGGKE